MIKTNDFFHLNQDNWNGSITSNNWLQLGNGGLHKFKTRNKCKRFYSHGKSFNVTLKNVSEQLPEIIKKLSKCSIQNTRNADEFGLFYE